jgi:diguanylate cyclase (GGDEF)-like protein
MKVLVTEDSAVYQHLLVTQLREWGLDVEAVSDSETALPAISSAEEPTLLLVDWELPGMSGIELLSAIRRLSLKHYVYAIVLTARSDKGDMVEALNAGADDCLVKPFHTEELQARVQVARRTLALHEELVIANERLENLASQDPLTGLLNRRALMNAFHRERLRALRNRSSITLVICDIDRFKQVNDSYGHGAGDDVIRLVARELQRSSRGSDVVARIGGDEFLVVLPESKSAGAVAFVKRVQKGIQDRNEMCDVPISVSFGIAEMDLAKPEETAIAMADAALYAAKHEGRDRYSVAQSS